MEIHRRNNPFRTPHACLHGAGVVTRFTFDQVDGAKLVVRVKLPRTRARIPRTCRRALRMSWFGRRWSYIGFAP